MKHILSKSTFMYGCQCPKRLFLHKFEPSFSNPDDEQQQAIFQFGTDTGELAQELFPGGANAQGDEEWHSYKTVAVTEKLLPVHSVIYEAAFIHEGVLCAVDILVRKGKKYYAYEVKSTNSVKPQHITDAALQYHVLKNAGIDLEDFSIVHFNNEYTRIGTIDVQQLFTADSVLEQILEQQDFIEPKIAELKLILTNKVMPEIEVGKQCEKPYPCNFTDFCFKDIIVEEEIEEEVDPTIHFDKDSVNEFIESVEYPIYYFDFETIQYGIPEFDYSNPYQQIPFQYSLHVQDAINAPLKHFEYLGDGVTDPRERLIIQLINEIGTKGSVMVWNQTFEIGCLKKLAAQFPKYETELLAIIERVVDLMVPFRKKHVNSDAFYGSYSIKNVLPVMVPELKYADLEIQEGGTASFTYGQLQNMFIEDQNIIRKQLLDYCHLDTLAMVKIWERMNTPK